MKTTINDLDYDHMKKTAAVVGMLTKFKIVSAKEVADDVKHTLKHDFCEYCNTHKWGDCPCYQMSKMYEG